jgi:hypothetical protein
MADTKSDPPVSIPPINADGDLVITAGKGGKKATLTIQTTPGQKLKLIVTRGDAKFEAPIDKGRWTLEIVEVP